jgi:hypothetical protein
MDNERLTLSSLLSSSDFGRKSELGKGILLKLQIKITTLIGYKTACPRKESSLKVSRDNYRMAND